MYIYICVYKYIYIIIYNTYNYIVLYPKHRSELSELTFAGELGICL